MGARLGRYTVLKHLATGGMADVLLGRTDGIEGFERHVVLKRIKPEHARDQRFIRMFLDEARVAANLHHQHIVQVHDIGESAGEYFIAMEYIHGEDVRTILSSASKSRAHVPLGHAIALVSAAAAGLHYAHERRGTDKRPLGIVHRDVSPSNILVGYDGSVKVVDFGIAKATMRQETRSGGLKGKVSYMSPEQCKSDEIDRRSDVYSLGVVLYELATTTRLFKGENDYLVMDQIVNGRVSLPRVRRPDLPNELSAIIMRALAPDPERRYFTADELRVALDQFAAKAGLTTSTSGIAAYMRKQFGERPEPWLELAGQRGTAYDDVQTSVGEPRATSWTELPRAEHVRTTGAIARLSGPIAATGAFPTVQASELAPEPAAHDSLGARDERSAARLPTTPPPTESKMGWESQPAPAATPRGFPPAKLAMICAPLIVILGVAIWRLADSGANAPVVATSKPPPAQLAPAPLVTPIPEPVHVAAPEPAAAPAMPPVVAPAVTVRNESAKRASQAAQPSSASSQPSGSSRRVATAKVAEASKADAKEARDARDAKLDPAAGPSPAALAALAPAAPPPAAPAPAPAAIAATPPAPAGAPPAAMAGGAALAPAAAPPPQDIGLPQLGHALVERVASDHSKELSKCDDNENLHGDVTVKFMIDMGGKVSKAQVATSLKKPKFIACILRVLQKFQFPKQPPGGAQATYTLSFQ